MGQAHSQYIYWTEGGDIKRANLGGTGVTTLVSGLNGPAGIALDTTGLMMYWTDYGSGDIKRANLDGSGQVTLISGLPTPWGIAVAP